MIQQPAMNLALHTESNCERFLIRQDKVNFGNGQNNHPSSSRSSVPCLNDKKISFTMEQIECVCEVLQNTENFDRLKHFLWSLPTCDKVQGNEYVVKSKAILAYKQGKYRELYRILESFHFSTKSHEALQSLWIQGDLV